MEDLLAPDLRNWTDNTSTDQRTKATPATAASNGELHLVRLRDDSNDLWHSWTTDGISWTERPVG